MSKQKKQKKQKKNNVLQSMENTCDDTKRNSRAVAMISMISIFFTVTAIMFNLGKNIISNWPINGGTLYYFLWVIIVVEISIFLLIIGDVFIFLYYEFRRYDLCQKNILDLDEKTDRWYTNLLFDYIIFIGSSLLGIILAGCIYILNDTGWIRVVGYIEGVVILIVFLVVIGTFFKDKKELVWKTVKKIGIIMIIAVSVFFTILIALVSTDGTLSCYFKSDGTVIIENAKDDTFNDANIIIMDSSEHKIYEKKIAKDDTLIAIEALKKNMSDTENSPEFQSLSGEMQHWKYLFGFNTVGLSDGEYYFLINISEGNTTIQIKNMFQVQEGVYFYAKDSLKKKY